uniref:Uncharacterized protein n=1 Tax=Rhizophora mucronata TaxID=61149 RepID=A0A2P2R5G7_RHIMU
MNLFTGKELVLKSCRMARIIFP